MGSFVKISCKNCEWAKSSALDMGRSRLAKFVNCIEILSQLMQDKTSTAHSGEGNIHGIASLTTVLTFCGKCQKLEFHKHVTVHAFEQIF